MLEETSLPSQPCLDPLTQTTESDGADTLGSALGGGGGGHPARLKQLKGHNRQHSGQMSQHI